MLLKIMASQFSHDIQFVLPRPCQNLLRQFHYIVIVCSGQSLICGYNNCTDLSFFCRNLFPHVKERMLQIRHVPQNS